MTEVTSTTRYGTGVVCLSGGMDSAVTAAIATRQCECVLLLHVNYGQRTAHREQQCFELLAQHFGAADTLVVSLDFFNRIGGSSLTDKKIPVATANPNRIAIPNSYVPFRNTNIMAIAVSWAESCRADAIYIGAVYEDGSGYPDCRPEFFDAFQQTVNLGTHPQTRLRIETPVLHMAKSEIVRTGIDLGVPFEATWSCYQNEEIACGCCDSCVLRQRAFHRAGTVDPIPYKT